MDPETGSHRLTSGKDTWRARCPVYGLAGFGRGLAGDGRAATSAPARGSTSRWGGEPGRPDRRPEGAARHPACGVLPGAGVSQAWFYKWRHGDNSVRHKRRRALAATIAYLFKVHHGTYGSPRITADLHEAGWRVSPNTVAELMAEQGLSHDVGASGGPRLGRTSPHVRHRTC